MADVITRFKLETTQYDSKLRDASKSLSEFARNAASAGEDFSKLSKESIEAAQAFGRIGTNAMTSKGKVQELVGAFNDVAKVYNKLTAEQQQSDFGKALAESMTTLKGRISEAKAEMNSTGGILSQLKERFTINIDALKLFNAGLTAAKAALDVAKDAFLASEANVDEWGRVMDSSKSLYEGFLTALNTGDISGYLSRIDSIVKAARAAYDELDRLGTMKTIQAPQMSAQQTENERMRMMIQTGRYIAPVDGRRASMQNGQLLTPDQIKRIEQQLQGGMQKVVTLVGNEVAQTGRAIDAVYNRQAQELGMSLKEFRKGTSSMAEFDKRMAGYDQYQKWRAEHTTIDMQSGRETVARGNPFEQFAKWGTFRVDGDRYNDLVKLIQQRDQQAGQAYSMQSQAYRTMNRAEGVTLRQLMGGGSGGGGGRSGGGKTTTAPTYAAGSLAEAQADVQRLTKLWNEAGADVRNQYLQPLIEAEQKVKGMQNELQTNKEIAALKDSVAFQTEKAANDTAIVKKSDSWHDVADIPAFEGFSSPLTELENHLQELIELQNTFGRVSAEAWQGYQKEIDATQEKIDQFKGSTPIEKLEKDAINTTKSFQQAAGAVSAIGSAMQSIEDPTAKIAGMIAQAIASIAVGFSEMIGKDIGSKGNVWYGIATAAAGMASMVATISQIHSATGYAEGGIIKGNSYSGDKIGGVVDGSQFVGLNAGELVLNASQQSMLANNLQNGGDDGGGYTPSFISGEQIYIALNRYTRRSGKGELVTWR